MSTATEAHFAIRADNPNGLNFDHLATGIAAAKPVLARIVELGGINITINGQAVSDDMIARLLK